MPSVTEFHKSHDLIGRNRGMFIIDMSRFLECKSDQGGLKFRWSIRESLKGLGPTSTGSWSSRSPQLRESGQLKTGRLRRSFSICYTAG
jgi:hypothetical protein